MKHWEIRNAIYVTTPKGTSMLDDQNFIESPLNKENGFKAWFPDFDRLCISCGAKTNMSGELPCGH